MKTIELKYLEKEVYEETLDNGLKIYLVPFENKKDYFITYATRFGSEITSFKIDNEYYTPPLGIAHFLEHKMFEEKSGEDPFTYFSISGTDSNASTTFNNTEYLCTGTKNFENNLRYLIKFVNSPYYTDENVNKEKGIIAEEIKMYQDMPDFKLEMNLRECLYKNHPRKIDIAGTIDEINKITKEDLYKCYDNFYVPNNMFILIVGNFDINSALTIIKDELNKKEKKELPTIKKINEQIKINKKEYTFYSNIEVAKIAVGLKVPNNKKLNTLEQDLYLEAITNILFSSSSEFRERARTSNLINNIYTEWEKIDGINTFYLMASTNKPDKLIEEVKYELENHSITEKSFNRLKKVWQANEYKMIDNMDSTINNIYNDIIDYKKIINNKIDIIKKMNMKKLNEVIKTIDFDNYSIVRMLPKNSKK